jgi:hypothetical protein
MVFARRTDILVCQNIFYLMETKNTFVGQECPTYREMLFKSALCKKDILHRSGLSVTL